jgi:hypothetical protein
MRKASKDTAGHAESLERHRCLTCLREGDFYSLQELAADPLTPVPGLHRYPRQPPRHTLQVAHAAEVNLLNIPEREAHHPAAVGGDQSAGRQEVLVAGDLRQPLSRQAMLLVALSLSRHRFVPQRRHVSSLSLLQRRDAHCVPLCQARIPRIEASQPVGSSEAG